MVWGGVLPVMLAHTGLRPAQTLNPCTHSQKPTHAPIPAGAALCGEAWWGWAHSPQPCARKPPAQNENFNLKTSANRKEEGSRFPGFTPSVSKPCTLTTPREGGSPVVGVVPAMSERQARQRAAFADVVARGVGAVAGHSTAPNHTGRGKRN